MPKPTQPTPFTELYEKCDLGTQQLKQLRDYASRPENMWLARNELAKLNQTIVELEQLLEDIKDKTERP